MKKNPYAGASFHLKDGAPVTDLKINGMTALSSSTGEINAWNKKDLVQVITQLMSLSSQGEIQQVQNTPFKSLSSQEQREYFAEAISSDQNWADLGVSLSTSIQEQRDRQAFIRSIAKCDTIKQGEMPRVTVQLWDAVAVVASGPMEVGYQNITAKQFYVPEFELIANVRASNRDLNQIGSQILDELYNQGLQSMLTKTDLVWKNAADLSVGVVNPLEYISGQLTPQNLAAIRQNVTDWGLPANTAIISNDYWQDIIGNNDFSSFLDPVSKYDLVLNGKISTLVGLTLITDGFRAPNQQVLKRGEIYVVSDAEFHGCFTDRGPIVATPTSGADMGSTSRGWLLSDMISFVLANPRSVAKGKRV